jgi:drug/metabolite transporter (DMT)-like permease
LSETALILVLGAAVCHAAWNLLAKQVGGGSVWVWVYVTSGALFSAPLAAGAILAGADVSGETVLLVVVSGCLHAGYFVALQRGYDLGDLSLVYPLARGAGAGLAAIVAILVLDERPAGLALAGGAVLVAGVLSLADLRAAAGHRPAVAAALTTAVFIAMYSVWDGRAIREEHVSPLVFLFGANVTPALLLTPHALRRRDQVTEIWRRARGRAAAIGALAVTGYLLVLYALQHAPVSVVAPSREVAILIGVVLGATALGEGATRRRMTCATAMVVGIALLAAS